MSKPRSSRMRRPTATQSTVTVMLAARVTPLCPGRDEAKNYFAGAGWGAACGAGVPKFTFGTSREPSAALK